MSKFSATPLSVFKFLLLVSLFGTLVLFNNCSQMGSGFTSASSVSGSIEQSSSVGQDLNCSVSGSTYSAGQSISGYAMSSVVYPVTCGNQVTRTCLASGQFDGAVPLFDSCNQQCILPDSANQAVNSGTQFMYYTKSSGTSQADCDSAKRTSSCSASTGLFSPSVPAASARYASCLVQGQTCAYTAGTGIANPTGNMTGATVAGYAAQAATYPAVCGAQVTRTCQASGQWTGMVPVYTACVQKCVQPDTQMPVDQGSSYVYYTISSGTQTQCNSARVTSTCSASTGLFNPAVGATRYATCNVIDPSGSPVITLNGFTGAGSKSTLQPIFFQNFKATSQGQSVTAAGYVDLGNTAGTGPAYVDMADGYGGGSLLVVTGPGSNEAPGENFWHIVNHLPSNTVQTYRAFWQKITKLNGPAGGSMQLKSTRQGKMPEYYGSPIFKSSQYISSSDGDFIVLHRSYLNQSGVAIQDSALDNAPYPKWNKSGWNFIEVFARHNDIGQSNGRYFYKINGVTMFDESGFSMRTSSADTIEYNYLVPGFDATPGTNWEIRYSNDYLDNSLARVVLTNHATYSQSTKWALQPVNSWGDSQIQIQSNPAGFTKGTTGYYHVFSSSGAEIASIPITIP